MINKYFIVNKYAESLFEAAVESHQLDNVFDDLTLISSLFGDDFKQMLKIVNSSEVAVQKFRSSEYFLKSCDIVKNFLNVLIENNRIELADEIIEEFFELKYRYDKSEKITIETANELSAEEKQEIEKLLSGISQFKVYFKFNVDPDLIYGIRIIYKAKVLDFSLQGMLDNLKFNEV